MAESSPASPFTPAPQTSTTAGESLEADKGDNVEEAENPAAPEETDEQTASRGATLENRVPAEQDEPGSHDILSPFDSANEPVESSRYGIGAEPGAGRGGLVHPESPPPTPENPNPNPEAEAGGGSIFTPLGDSPQPVPDGDNEPESAPEPGASSPSTDSRESDPGDRRCRD